MMNWIVLLVSLFTLKFVLSVDQRCRNSWNRTSISEFTFEPSLDGVEGRYIAEYCIQMDVIFKEWVLNIFYMRNISSSDCNEKIESLYSYKYYMHHTKSLQIKKNLECPNTTCLSSTIEMIVTGCYYITNEIRADNRNAMVNPSNVMEIDNKSTRKYITNNILSYDYFTKSSSSVTFTSNGGNVSLEWQFGRIPFSSFNLKISCNETYICSFQEVNDAEPNCTLTTLGARPTTVTCAALQLPPGCYKFWLRPADDWASSTVFTLISHFETVYCHGENAAAEPAPDRGEARDWAGWAGVALCVLALSAAVACALWRRRKDLRRWNKRLWHDWRNRTAEARGAAEAAGAGADGAEGVEVVLLYAREEAARGSVAALSAALADGGARVLDPHAAATLGAAAAAGAPRRWMATALARGARVLVLRTPASAAAAAARTARARPAYSDDLVRFALALLAETPPRPDQYNKYFIAELEGVPCGEWCAALSALRVYALPGAARALMRDVLAGAGAPPADPMLIALERELAAFARLAADNPDYYTEDLVYLGP